MSIIEELEREVSEQASQRSVDVVLLLLERWEERIQEEFKQGKITAKELLYQYVKMKISLHHLSRKYERDWYYDLEMQHKVESQLLNMKNKVKDARRNYYVAKHRIESDKHGHGCSCRGCKCIAGIGGGTSYEVGQDSDGA